MFPIIIFLDFCIICAPYFIDFLRFGTFSLYLLKFVFPIRFLWRFDAAANRRIGRNTFVTFHFFSKDFFFTTSQIKIVFVVEVFDSPISILFTSISSYFATFTGSLELAFGLQPSDLSFFVLFLLDNPLLLVDLLELWFVLLFYPQFFLNSCIFNIIKGIFDQCADFAEAGLHLNLFQLDLIFFRS